MINCLCVKPIVKNIYFWISVWVSLVALYALSLKYSSHTVEANYAVYLLQLVADLCIGLFGYLAYRKQSEKKARKFYTLIFLSLIPGLFANEVYNVLINIAGINSITSKVSVYWVVAYTAFLLLQIYSWSYLLMSSSTKLKHKTWLASLPYIQSAMTILLSLISITLFRDTILNEIGVKGILNSILETILFILISASLSKTKNESLIYLETGFLLLIAFNLVHRFSYALGCYFKTFDVAWMISLIIIIFGLSLSRKDKGKIDFFENNSIHVLTSAIFITFSTCILIVFVLIEFFITSIALNSLNSLNVLVQNVPSALIFSYCLSLLFGKLIGNQLSKPIERISRKIDLINSGQSGMNQLPRKQFLIREIDKLDKFILETITKLQHANRVKSEFLMNMSHDFRTPASGIYHMSRSVYRRIQNPDLKKLQKLVVDSSEQLMNFLEDILEYSRFESGQRKLKIQEFDVKTLINEIILFHSAKATEKGISLDTEFMIKKSYYYGDTLIIKRILLNLVSNAIKFTEVGFVRLSISEENDEDKQWLKISVMDSGIGIGREYHQVIFEPFSRVESAETGRYSGIGLGLSNVVLMLKTIGGSISLESTLDVGSIFIVYLPLLNSEHHSSFVADIRPDIH